MNYKNLFNEKLNSLLFLEVKWDGFKKSVGIPQNIKLKNSEVYIPISSKYITSNINDQIKINNLPIYYFIEGMLLSMGADENLKFKEDYIIILNNISDSEECGKSLVADRVKEDNLEEAYLLLKGLYIATGDEEYYKKLLLVGESIREKDSGFEEILLKDIDEGKKEFIDMPDPYLYKAIILRKKEDFLGAKVEINEYINKGGEITKEIKTLIDDIENVSNYEKAVEMLDKDPKEAFKMLVDLSEKFDKNPLIYYYLGVASRKLENFNKAIYYLNKSLEIESGMLEVVTELGINYACLGEYEEALAYFEKAFEASRDVETCTNIVMCYLNLGNMEKAKEYLEEAKKINSEDEIVKQLVTMLKGK